MNNYDWINENVAIGNHKSSYDEFDVIVNLNYPFNNVSHNEIKKEIIITNFREKLIINVGIYDDEKEDMSGLLDKLIPYLVYLYETNKKIKILFHCYAGISRSSTLAIAFLCKTKNMCLTDALMLAKKNRSIVNPNVGFINSLKKYTK